MKVFDHIDIETHSVCNRACTYCPVSVGARSEKAEMPYHVFRKVIEELATLEKPIRINLNLYNEPLMDDRIGFLVYTIKSKAPLCKPHIYTNGDYLTESVIEQLFRLGLESMKITDHNPKPNPRLAKLYEWARENGYWGVTLGRFNANSKLKNRAGLIDHPSAQSSDVVCWPRKHSRTYIDYRGNVIGCCDDATSEVIFGNVAEEKLLDIWASPKYVQFRNGLDQGRYYYGICERCNFNAGKHIKLETPHA